MPLTTEKLDELRQQALEMTTPHNELLGMASKLPKEQALKVLHTAAFTGMDIEEAAKYPHAVIESIIGPDDFEAIKKSGALKTYGYLQDPIHMAAVRTKQRVEALADMEAKRGAGTAFWNGVKGIFSAGLGAASIATDLAKAGEQTAPLTLESKLFSMDTVKRAAATFVPDRLRTIVENHGKEWQEELKPEEVRAETTLGQYGYDLIQHAPQMIAQVLLAYASGGATAPMLFMGSQIAGAQYQELRSEGVDAERAAQASVANAMLQAPLERLGLDKMLSAGKLLTKGKAREVLKSALTEGVTEWIQQYPEDAAAIWAKHANLSAPERVAKFLDEFGEITQKGLYSGAIGAFYGGVGGATHVALRRQATETSVGMLHEQIEVAEKAGIEPVIVEGVMKTTAPGEKVFIDGKALAGAMYQSANAELAEQLGVSDETVQQAAQAGQLLEVPMAKYCAAMTGKPELREALRKDIATEESGLTVRQAEMYSAPDIKKAQEEIFREESELEAAKKEISGQWKEGARGVKGVDAGVLNNAMTALVSHAQIMASAENMTPAEWLRAHAPRMRKAIYTQQDGMLQLSTSEINLRNDERAFAQDIDNFIDGKLKGQKNVTVMNTPLAMKLAGAEILPIKVDISILNKILKGKHANEITPDILKQMPRALTDPLMVLKSLDKNGAPIDNEMVVVLALKNTNGSTIMTPFVLDVQKGEYRVNAVKSFYGRESNGKPNDAWYVKQIERGGLLYVNHEKTTNWSQTLAQYIGLSSLVSNGGLSNTSIHNERDLYKLKKDYPEYYQDNEDPRGMIQWDEEGRAIISLFEKADASTVIHEMAGHFFMGNLLHVGELDTAPQWMKNARKTMLEFGGIENWEAATEAEKKAAHEKWASAAETYLLEGKAPSLELRGVFRRFRDWIVAVYRQLKQNKVQITPEVREVFDRLLASDAAIKEREVVDEYHKRLPADVLESLSPAAQRELDKSLLNARSDAEELARAKLMQAVTAQNKAAMAEERTKAEARIGEVVAKEPLYRAMDIVAEEFPAFSKTAKGFAQKYLDWRSKELPEVEANAEARFDLLAESLGYSSGDELAQKILAAPTKQQEIQSRVDAFMEQRFEDAYNDPQRVAETAQSAMYGDDGAYLVAMEQQVIEEKLGRAVKADERRKLAALKRESMKAAAKKALADQAVEKASRPHTYMQAERSAAKRAEKALLEKDYELAAYEKSVQLYNHAMVMESLRIKREFEKARRYLKRQQKAKKETWIKEEHFGQAAAILQRVGAMRKDYEPSSVRESLQQWAERVNEIEDNVAIADWLLFGDSPIDLKKLPLEQTEDVVNALKNIKHIAQSEGKLSAASKQEDLLGMIEAGSVQLNRLKDEYIPQIGQDEQPIPPLELYRAALENRDTLLARLDGWSDGFFSEVFGASVQEKTDAEVKLRMEYYDQERASYKEWLPTKAAEKAANTKVHYAELGCSADKFTLIEIALHTGSDSNRHVLFSKRPVGVEELKESPLWVEGDKEQTGANVMAFLQQHMNEADWDYVQRVWDNCGRFWPMIQELDRRTKGFAERGVEPYSFKVALPDGKTKVIRGGYHPLSRDTREGSKPHSKPLADESLAKQNAVIRTMHTSTGHTKARTGAAYQVDLSRNNRYRSVNNAIHDLCFRELVGDFRRLMNVEEFAGLLKRKLGRARYMCFRDYLMTTADPWAVPELNMADRALGDFATKIRRKTTNVAIMLNVKTAVQNLGNPFLYANAVEGFGYADTLRGLCRGLCSVLNPAKYKFETWTVMEKSIFMRERAELPDFTLRDLQSENLNAFEKKTIAWGTQLLVFSDNLSARPMWLEAYEKKIKVGASEKEATMFADDLIRKTLGSSRVTDVAPLLRGGPLAKLFTTFQGFFNTQYQQWAREYNVFLKDRDIMRLTAFVASKWLLFAVANMALAFENPFDEEKRRDLYKELLTYPANLAGPAGTFAAEAVTRFSGFESYGYRMTAVQSTFDQALRVIGKAGKATTGEAELQDLLEASSGAAGLYYGVPAQFNKWFWNAYDILFGGMEPQLGDVYKRRPRRER